MADKNDKHDDYRRFVKDDYARRRAELERRRHERIDARVPIQFESEKDYVEAYTHNISKGGVYFETKERLSPNGRLELVLSPPGSEGQIRVIARVIRMITRYREQPDGTQAHVNGYGVRFEKLETEDSVQLEALFKEFQPSSSDDNSDSQDLPPEQEGSLPDSDEPTP